MPRCPDSHFLLHTEPPFATLPGDDSFVKPPCLVRWLKLHIRDLAESPRERTLALQRKLVGGRIAWEPKVNSVISKVSQKIGILRRNIDQLSPSARRLFYLAVIQPDLEYAATATIPFVSTSLRDRLCSVWRRAVRCVAGADWQAEVAPILKNHRLTSIEHRWALQFAVVVRRYVQKPAPLSLCAQD